MNVSTTWFSSGGTSLNNTHTLARCLCAGPEYLEHQGQPVEILDRRESPNTNPLYLFQCEDGWQGVAFEDELIPIQ